jgi:hypothetical protein
VVPKLRKELSDEVVTIVKRPAAVNMNANAAVLEGATRKE